MDISNTTTWVAPDLLKALTILSGTAVRRSEFLFLVYNPRIAGTVLSPRH